MCRAAIRPVSFWHSSRLDRGLAMIWHIWWMVTLGVLGGLAVGLIQAWRIDNETEVQRRGRRRHRAGRLEQGALGMSQSHLSLVQSDDLPRAARPLSERGPAPTSNVVGYGFWLFLLSDVIHFRGPVCRLRGSVRRDGRRADGRPTVRQASCLHRNRVPAGVERHLWLCGIGRPASRPRAQHRSG